MKRIRVAVIDDHSVVRMGLKFTVRLFKDLDFVGEHDSGAGAADFVARVKPDVTLLDIRMPGTDGIAALEEILAANPKAELCAFKDGTWLRVSGELVNDDRLEAKEHMLDGYPELKAMYSADDGNTQVLYFKNATAVFSSFTAPPRTVTF